MLKTMLVALVIAAPGVALAQLTSPAANQANPQAETNMAQQPRNAQSVQKGPGAGDATHIPAPVLNNRPMQPVPQQPGVPRSTVVR